MTAKPHNGFTLLEIAIVITIIGLIAGGILFGRDIVINAENRGIMQQVYSYKVAFRTFQEKYKCIPGDCLKATDYWPQSSDCTNVNLVRTTDTCNGDGNEQLTPFEGWCSWQQLSLANLVNGKFSCSFLSAPTVGNKNQIPNPAAGPMVPIMRIYYSTYVPFAGYALSPGNIFEMVSYRGGLYRPGFTPTQAKYLDDKMDDGYPYDGNMQAQIVYGFAPPSVRERIHCATIDDPANLAYVNGFASPEPDTYWVDPPVYRIDVNAVNCQFGVRISY